MNAGPASPLNAKLRELGAVLQRIHGAIFDLEREFDPSMAGMTGLARLTDDPAWAWLRAISSLIAQIDHVLSLGQPVTEYEVAALASHVRGTLFGLGDKPDENFLARYRPLLQQSTALAIAHGELKRLLDGFPAESANESERLHARHVWAERCKQRLRQ